MARTARLSAVCLLMGLSLAPGPARAAAAVVHITADFSFVPQVVSILPGESVVWSNETNFTHTITDEGCVVPPGACDFDTTVDPGLTLTRSFAAPGIHPYRCRIHNFTGTVKVVDPSGALPDLVVESIVVRAVSATAPTTQRITVVVRNRSGAAAADKSEVLVQYRSGQWRTIGLPLTNPIAAGASATVHQLWSTPTKAGDFPVRAVADGLGQIAESDEGNNAADTSASILLPPGVLTPGLDLDDTLPEAP